jgi:hypothetical protein
MERESFRHILLQKYTSGPLGLAWKLTREKTTKCSSQLKKQHGFATCCQSTSADCNSPGAKNRDASYFQKKKTTATKFLQLVRWWARSIRNEAAKMRLVAMSRLSVHTIQLKKWWTGSHAMWKGTLLHKFANPFQLWLKSDTNYFVKRTHYRNTQSFDIRSLQCAFRSTKTGHYSGMQLSKTSTSLNAHDRNHKPKLTSQPT